MGKDSYTLHLHYYFQDKDRHSLNAFVRNDNERDFLAILRHAFDITDADIQIEVLPQDEGGFIDKYKLVARTVRKAGGIITIVLTGVSAYFAWKTYELQLTVTDSQIQVNQSQDQLNRLQIEEIEGQRILRQREIRKKIKLIELDSTPKTQKEKLGEEVSKGIADTLSKDYKALWHRSKFFDRSIKTPEIITKITTQTFNEREMPVSKEHGTDRPDFQFFVLKTTSVDSLIDKDARIVIISPVLDRRKYTWRGLYNNDVITFSMLDKLFIQKIQLKQVEFTNGTTIRCVLEQKRRIDDTTGLIKIIKSSVLRVADVDDEDTTLQIPPRRSGSKTGAAQLDLPLTTKRRR